MFSFAQMLCFNDKFSVSTFHVLEYTYRKHSTLTKTMLLTVSKPFGDQIRNCLHPAELFYYAAWFDL